MDFIAGKDQGKERQAGTQEGESVKHMVRPLGVGKNP